MGRVVISAGRVPLTTESLQRLADEVQEQLGDEHRVLTEGRPVRRAPAQLRLGREERLGREKRDLPVTFDPFVDVVLDIGKGVTVAGILAGIKIAVKKWRDRGKVPPRKVTRIRVWELDEDGNQRSVWIEEAEAGSDKPN